MTETHARMIGNHLDIMLLVGRLHRIGFDLLENELYRIGASDLTSAHAFVLLNIAHRTNSIDEVRNRTNYVGATFTKIIQTLVSRGYVWSERSPYDRRVYEVWLSEKGKLLHAQLADSYDQSLDRFFAHLGRPELDRTIRTLQQIEDLLIDQTLDR